MYMVSVCILCATAVIAVASIIFAVTIAALTISHSVNYALSALRTLWSERILASRFEWRLLTGTAPRRAR